jgi:hypothetical protein
MHEAASNEGYQIYFAASTIRTAGAMASVFGGHALATQRG